MLTTNAASLGHGECHHRVFVQSVRDNTVWSSSMHRTIKGRLEGLQRSGVSLIQRHLQQGRCLRTAPLAFTESASNFAPNIAVNSCADSPIAQE